MFFSGFAAKLHDLELNKSVAVPIIYFEEGSNAPFKCLKYHHDFLATQENRDILMQIRKSVGDIFHFFFFTFIVVIIIKM
jgi:hypothetical protein